MIKTILKKIIIKFYIIFLYCLFLNAEILLIDEQIFTEDYLNSENKISNIHFNKSNNDFGGVIIRTEPKELAIAEKVSLNGELKYCHKQLRGLYYNSARGNNLRPIDEDSLIHLQNKSLGYEQMIVTGGLFTQCEGTSYDDIYGQVTHNINNNIYKLIAGVEFQNNSYLANYSTSRFFFNGYNNIGTGNLYDNYGGVADILGSGNINRSNNFTSMPISNDNQEIINFFINAGYNQGTGALINVDNNTLIGNKDINLSNRNDGKVCPGVDIVFQTTNSIMGNIGEIQMPNCFITKNFENIVFSGIIKAPQFISNNLGFELININKYITIDVGSTEKLLFQSTLGEDINMQFRLPIVGSNFGDILNIYYSQDGNIRDFLSTGIVYSISGDKYIDFQSNHFTYFTIGEEVGNFIINNDNPFTNSLNVQLKMNIIGATHMKFGNNELQRDNAQWIEYTNIHNRVLTGDGGTGTKTVYAMFKNIDNDIGYVLDTIIFDETYNGGDISDIRSFTIDTTSPNIDLINPSNGNILYTGTINFLRSGNDEGTGISGYVYNIMLNGVTIYSGTTTSTGIIIYDLINNNNYSRYVIAEDNAGNIIQSDTHNFIIQEENKLISIIAKLSTPKAREGDFRIFKKNGTQWLEIYNSAKSNGARISISKNGTGQINLQTRPSQGDTYLVAMKLDQALSIGYTGIRTDETNTINFSDINNANLYPKNEHLSSNYIILGDLLDNSIGTYDLIYGSDLTLININLSLGYNLVNLTYDLDGNGAINSIEQAIIINNLDKGGYILDYKPDNMNLEDFKTF